MFEAVYSEGFGWHVVTHEDPSNPYAIFNAVHLPDEHTARAVARLYTLLDAAAGELSEVKAELSGLKARVTEVESPARRGRMGF